MGQSVYWLSDIYFGQDIIKVKLIDLETGNDLTLGVDEIDKLTSLYNNFQNKQDINAIEMLQKMYAS